MRGITYSATNHSACQGRVVRDTKAQICPSAGILRADAGGGSVEEIGGVLQDDGHQALYEVALEGDGLVQGVAGEQDFRDVG